MRLKKIKLAGFKSFVDPTDVPMPSQLVGVVGPNGCGKSNVIDAVRWVMGESSAKNLRGDSLADVIFNGSTARKPVGQATVELVFDNSDGGVGGEYAKYAEISVRRQLSRDGQSSYYLNGSRCRRRDITDIFLGTGLGPRSYAIIEQGTISRLIEAKPEELRMFIEEAAGISKYKERRRETETRIRNTNENINRINDLRDELEKRLNVLQRQAKVAEKYKALKQEQRQVKAELLALRFRNLDSALQEREKEIQSRETQLEGQNAELRRLEAAMESQREQQIEMGEKFNEIQGRYYALGSEIARLEQSLQHARETRQRQAQELTEAQRAWEDASQHMKDDHRAVEDLQVTIAGQEEQLRIARQAEEEAADLLADSEEAMQAWQAQWDEFNHQASQTIRAAEVERARIQHLEDHLEQLHRRLGRLEEELAGLSDGQGMEEEITMLEQQRDQAEERLAQLRHQLQEQQDQLAAERELGQTLAVDLDHERGQRQAMHGRRHSLETLQQQALGRDQSAVNDWLQAQGLDGADRLAQRLDVDPDWHKAVEVVLGQHLESVCVTGMDNVAATLAQLNQGALAMFDVDARLDMADAGALAEPLLNKVRAERPPVSLLGNIYAAEDLPQALALRPQLHAHESVVTRDGVWLGGDWLRLNHGVDERAGVLQRERELKQLNGEIEQTDARIEALEQQLADSKARLHALEEGRDDMQSTLTDASQQFTRAEAQLGNRRERLEQLRNRQQRLAHDIEELRSQRHDDEQSLAQARVRLDEAMAQTQDYEERRETLSRERDQQRQQLDERRQQARASREQAQDIALALQSARAQLDGVNERMARMAGQLKQLERRREELHGALHDGEDPTIEMAAQLEELLGQRLGVEEELAGARRQVEDVDHAMRQSVQQRHDVEQSAQEMRSQLEQLRVASQEFKVRRQTVSEQFAETGLVMDEVFKALPEGAEEGQWTGRQSDLEQKIQRLGAINLAAIDEYQEQSERKGYLDAQHDDLIEALTTLENAIRKIDKETRTRFKDTFDKVNSGVQTLFPRLFGGGHAYLDLTGEDLLDTGVSVMARPPGKRNSSIHLLSGGEKALTAVALVFSIFQLNPAPFCMLDEVDAPLDEANVGRFCKMVSEMSEKVQFIFITHNKTTMEMAEHLTGVTMHEPGVSRLVAVDIEEAAQMAAS